MKLSHWLSTSTALGIAAGFGLLLSALALQDIAHGEADVRSEWWALRIGFFLMGLFIVVALLTLGRARRATRQG